MNQQQEQHTVSLFLDSGAFSAFTQGVEIDIQEYIAFVKEHEEHLEVYANLDSIGSPEKTWENQQTMEEAGLHPLPCFHYGENPKWLKRYLKHHEYIALGGMVPISNADLQVWLDEIFTQFICDPSTGLPHTKVHGFGMTSHKLMWRYPWYSVDSTSWVVTGRLGSILVPRFLGGQWNYREDPLKVCVSDRSPSKGEAGAHFSTFPRMEQRQILGYLEERGFRMGRSQFRLESAKYEPQDGERWHGKARADGRREIELVEEVGLSNAYQERDKLNIQYYLDLERQFPPWPWPLQIKERRGMGL